MTRFHTFLTGEDETVTRSYKCVIENRGEKTITVLGKPVSTLLPRETCQNPDQEFLNLYWMSALQAAWSSPVNGSAISSASSTCPRYWGRG